MFHGPGRGRWFQDDSSTLHFSCTLSLSLLHQLHLRASVISSQSLGIPGLKICAYCRDSHNFTYQQMLMVKTYINCFLTPPYLQIPSCYLHNKGFPGGSVVKNLPANAGSIPLENPLEREMATTPIFLPRKFHKQTSLAGVHGVTKNWT